MTKSRGWVLGSVLVLAGFVLWRFELVREPELRIATGDRTLLAALPLPEGRFEHVFVHSVHRTPVRECFEVQEGHGGVVLHLHELRYQSQGVGMPSDAEGGYRLDHGTFILSMDRTFPELPIMVSPVAGHGILADAVFFPFSNYVQSGHRLVLSARMTRHIRLRR